MDHQLSDEDRAVLREKTREYVHHNAETLKKLGLKSKLNVSFPGKKRIPLLGRLGIWLVNLAGGMMDMELRPRDDES